VGKVLEKMKKKKAAKIVGKGVKTRGNGKSSTCGLQ
jgi:hypothetical protein